MTFLFTPEVEKAVDGCEKTVRCILKSYQKGGWDSPNVIVVNVCLSFETEDVGLFRVGRACFQGSCSGT